MEIITLLMVTMFIFFIIVFTIMGLILLVITLSNMNKNINNETKTQNKKGNFIDEKYRYYIYKNILTKTEYIFYKKLKLECDKKNILIFPKVRMEDFISVVNTKEIYKYRGYIKSRHIDFLLCDYNTNLLAGIELDDTTHNTKKAKEVDNFKDNIFKKINKPLYRVRTNANYDISINNIMNMIDDTITLNQGVQGSSP